MNFNFFLENPDLYEKYNKHALKWCNAEYTGTEEFIKAVFEDILLSDTTKLPNDYKVFLQIMIDNMFDNSPTDKDAKLRKHFENFIANVNIHYKPEILNSYTKKKLHRLCKLNDIKAYTHINKKELVELIKNSI